MGRWGEREAAEPAIERAVVSGPDNGALLPETKGRREEVGWAKAEAVTQEVPSQLGSRDPRWAPPLQASPSFSLPKAAQLTGRHSVSRSIGASQDGGRRRSSWSKARSVRIARTRRENTRRHAQGQEFAHTRNCHNPEGRTGSIICALLGGNKKKTRLSETPEHIAEWCESGSAAADVQGAVIEGTAMAIVLAVGINWRGSSFLGNRGQLRPREISSNRPSQRGGGSRARMQVSRRRAQLPITYRR